VIHVTTTLATPTHILRLSKVAILLRLFLPPKAVLPLLKPVVPIHMLHTVAIKTTPLCGMLLWLRNSKAASKVSSVEA
jgi:hypothetical protein